MKFLLFTLSEIRDSLTSPGAGGCILEGMVLL